MGGLPAGILEVSSAKIVDPESFSESTGFTLSTKIFLELAANAAFVFITMACSLLILWWPQPTSSHKRLIFSLN